MKKVKNYYLQIKYPLPAERKWIFLLSLVSIFLLFIATFCSLQCQPLLYSFAAVFTPSDFVESKLHTRPLSTHPPPPRFAYLISGSKGDGKRLRRTLLALYHPNNFYIIHLDADSTLRERGDLLQYVRNHSTFLKFGNVKMIEKANLVTYRGPTMVANTLHAASILLREGGDWDWFINLSASDYPLVTQDDLLHTFSYLPRELNFIDHTSDIGWKEGKRAKPVIIDPGLYKRRKSEVFWITQRRSVPTAFKLFTGSAWMVLSRPFVEFCIWGWDSLPRNILLYYTNFISSPEGYFHTVICNTQQFRNTTVNSDLHFISWDDPPKQHPHYLKLDHMQKLVQSNAPFARKFRKNDIILDKIDEELLFRGRDMVVPGGWCIGNRENRTDPCSVTGASITRLNPTAGARRLQTLITSLLSTEKFRPRQCNVRKKKVKTKK